MKRREFIKKCSVSALCLGSTTSMLTACQSTQVRYTSSRTNSKKELVIKQSEFDTQSYVLLQNPHDKYPICLFKTAADEYTASLMKCTHQHCTTDVVDNHFICPCHGAKFTSKGHVIKGPAEQNLRTYATRLDEKMIYISLR